MLKNNYSRERAIRQTNKQKPKIKPREVKKNNNTIKESYTIVKWNFSLVL